MNTKNMTTNKLKLAVLAAMAMLGLGGCASTSGVGNPDVEPRIKAKDGMVFAVRSGKKSVAKVCETFSATKDERCQRQEDFNAYLFAAKSHSTLPVAPLVVVALVPKTAGELNLLDVAKLRLDGLRPAYFEMIASRGGKDESCRFITNYPGDSGVACPKYNWDFRKDLE